MKARENWKVELATQGQTLAVVETLMKIFQRDSLLPLQFIIANMPLNYILRKCTGAKNSQCNGKR